VKVSPGCQNCYAEALNRRFGTGLPYAAGNLAQVEVFLDEQELRRILRARGGKRIFVGDMMDIFLDEVSDRMLDRVFGIFAARPDLTFLILTKRPQRMHAYLSTRGRREIIGEAISQVCLPCDWPLPNLWVGTTVEDQQRADERVPPLLATPAAVRWVSCEPLLGAINFSRIPYGNYLINPLTRQYSTGPLDRPYASGTPFCFGMSSLGGIDWVVVGGESGPKARPMHPAWAESLRDQCQAAGVSFFFKAWGAWYPDCWCETPHPNQTTPRPEPGGIGKMFRCGKSAGVGRRLEGQEWNELPGAVNVVQRLSEKRLEDKE
jgi:protein gp37